MNEEENTGQKKHDERRDPIFDLDRILWGHHITIGTCPKKTSSLLNWFREVYNIN